MSVRFHIAVTLLCCATVLPVLGSNPAVVTQQPSWALNRPAPEPILFAEGTVSTRDDEMDTTFAPDGQTMYFTRNHIGKRLGVILESKYQNGKWSPPDIASFSGRFTDYDPFISADGSKLFFASNRPITGSTKKDFDIWVVERSGQGWSEAKSLGDPINTPQDEFYPAVAADGTLYFSATRSDTRGRSDIYLSRWRDGKFAVPENLGSGVNSTAQEVDSYVAADQSFIIFAGFGRPDDLGNGDLYISEQVNGTWSPARHLGAGVNSAAREYCPAGSPDGKYFFFTSFRGFGDSVPDRAWTYGEFRAGMDSVLNGFGNIYQVDMAAVRNSSR